MMGIYVVLFFWLFLLTLALLGLIFGIKADRRWAKFWLIFEIYLLACAFLLIVLDFGPYGVS
jgi:hypothetical protein